MNDYDDVVQTIRDAKRISGFTNQQLADAANVPQSTVNKLLASGCNGKPDATHPNPTITFIGFLLVQTQRYSLP